MKDPYKVLEVDRYAEISQIKRAYRLKAKKYHPDLNPGDEKAAKKFRELSEAYDILQDPKKRDMYDRYGEAAFDQNAGAGFGFDINDIFGDLFSDFFGGRRSTASSYNRPVAGADIRLELEISFEEAYFGCQRTVEIKRDLECSACKGTGADKGAAMEGCPTCHGQGVINREVSSPFGRMIQQTTCPDCGGRGQKITKKCQVCGGSGRQTDKVKLQISIPAGVDDGNILPLRGQGHGGSKGGPAGDVYVIIRVRPSDRYKRHANDLYVDIPISFVQACLGDQLNIPTMEGEEKFELPAGTQTGSGFSLKGKGFKDVRSGRPGNLYFTVNVQVPKKLNNDQAKALKNFAEKMGQDVEGNKKFWDKVKEKFE